MFDNLSSRLKAVAERVRGKGRLTEENVGDAVRDVRRALIEADVALPVVKDFVEQVRQRATQALGTRLGLPGSIAASQFKEQYRSRLKRMSQKEFWRWQVMLERRRLREVQSAASRGEQQVEFWLGMIELGLPVACIIHSEVNPYMDG